MIYNMVRELGYKQENGKGFVQGDISTAVKQLYAEHKLGSKTVGTNIFYQIADENLKNDLYDELLATKSIEQLKKSLYQVLELDIHYVYYYWSRRSVSTASAVCRILVLGNAPLEEYRLFEEGGTRELHWCDVLTSAFTPSDLTRIPAAFHADIFDELLFNINTYWDKQLIPYVQQILNQDRNKLSDDTRYYLAEYFLHQGEQEQAERILQGLNGGRFDVLQAYMYAQRGVWVEAQQWFESGLKKRMKELGSKKQVFTDSIAWLYPLILLAQQSPQHLELARKFCISESGKREPNITSDWGQWVYAIQIKRGEAEPVAAMYKVMHQDHSNSLLGEFWRILLSAWLGIEPLLALNKAFRTTLDIRCDKLLHKLNECGFTWLVQTLEGAKKIIHEQEPPANYFIASKPEAWRELLAALQGLDDKNTTSTVANNTSRLVWLIDIGKQGELTALVAAEQKQGTRGWNKPKIISFSKVAESTDLPPHDLKVAQHIHPNKYNARSAIIDRANAIIALIGHPAVALEKNPMQFIELIESSPEIEVSQRAGKINLKITPPLRELDEEELYYYDAEAKREAEALRTITLIQDSAQRVRLFRFTPAQQRAAQLLSRKINIPASAQQEVQNAMQALSSHFQLQADNIQAAREIPCESRLRAELAPFADGLLLRLVATPLGIDGPRIIPGKGRARFMSNINNESVGTSRELKLERKYIESVLDALPFLENCISNEEQCEWEVPEPEDALAMVETLPSLPAIAGLDWPKGKAVRVIPLDISQLGIKVTSGKDWFKLEGEARVDESLVFQFEALLAAARNSSRFIAMGDGTYLALTRRLKDSLADLASVAETDKHGSKIPRLAAAWMDDALEGFNLQTDKEFRAAIKKLRDIEEQTFNVPKALQAELRPYQQDGYAWASRLAHAGFGACLADDMGLGKTLQSLAVLLSRAAGGPALIIAPTSVCGNWLAEAERFAPSLNMHLYSEAERETVIDSAAAFDVIVVSYNLLLQADEQFAKKHWHTVIADEAQAIKNAMAKRTQAVFELNADFRLALSGTPVENRLSELWSIMRFANPGLLGTMHKFNERFANPIERDKDRDALHILRRLISPFLLRRTKTQVLQELPPRTELVIKVEPSVAEASHYEALRRAAIAEADMALASGKAGQARLNILAQLTKLRRAACDPRIVSNDFPSVGSKIQTFIELATELVENGHKTLVFSQFVDFLEMLRQALDNVGLSYQYLDGSTPATERTKRVAEFQAGNSDLFLISLKAGGFGLNLTAADYVVITDPWWNPAAEDQAMGRAHRMGQKRPVTVYRLVTQGTVEEHIVGLHNDKRALAESILGEGEAVTVPSTDELISLIKGI